mmetsp:Transcript_7980/g.9610  ORF Transcript_7980/g.9610 Transcript_7980/m.9610 type:complete len:109 (+) Transcript_7980:240-566(+)
MTALFSFLANSSGLRGFSSLGRRSGHYHKVAISQKRHSALQNSRRHFSSRQTEVANPTTRNFISAAILLSFVTGVYFLTIRQIRVNNDFGADFDKPANEYEPEEEEEA